MIVADQHKARNRHMSTDNDMFDEFDEPTEPLSLRQQRVGADQAQVNPPGQSTIASSWIPPTQAASKPHLCRRELIGATAIGLAGLGAAASGAALEQWWQHGGLRHLFHGPVVGSMRIGHLLRRAGFGTNPDDLATYNSL